MRFWESGWRILIESLEALEAEDLTKIVQIRGEDFTVAKAVSRSLTHTAYHVGQITFLAKHFRSSEWQTLSIPKNESARFNQQLSETNNKGSYMETGGEFAEKLLKQKN